MPSSWVGSQTIYWLHMKPKHDEIMFCIMVVIGIYRVVRAESAKTRQVGKQYCSRNWKDRLSGTRLAHHDNFCSIEHSICYKQDAIATNLEDNILSSHSEDLRNDNNPRVTQVAFLRVQAPRDDVTGLDIKRWSTVKV